jgi:excisionase family DNA binding protein
LTKKFPRGNEGGRNVPQKVTFSTKEAAAYLGISYWLLLEMIKRGEIKPIKAGGRYLFRQAGLDKWMARQEEGEEITGEPYEKESRTLVRAK